jgi:hypothetical protein
MPFMNKHRGWVILAWIGCIMVLIALLAVAAATFDKDLVKSLFLEFVSGGVMAGGLIVFIAAWFLPERKTWRGITLMVWGLIAVTSPWFGLLFLVPWAVVAVMLPLVIAILRRQSRLTQPAIAATPVAGA